MPICARAAGGTGRPLRHAPTTSPDPRRPKLTTAVFLVAYDKGSGQPVGCGGLRLLDEHTAEIKRLYVLPYTRGSGVASSILAALEAQAHAQGITRDHC